MSLDFSALPLRSKVVVFVGARYKHVKSTNSKNKDLHTIGRLSELPKAGAVCLDRAPNTPKRIDVTQEPNR